MTSKAIIAVFGVASQGKSTTLWNVANLLATQFPNPISTIVPAIPQTQRDFTTVITIDSYLGPIKIGIESQGDPNTGIYTRLENLAQQNCDIIVCTSRTSGATVDSIGDIASKYQYEPIWTANYTSWKFKQSQLNHIFAENIVRLIKEIIAGRVYVPTPITSNITIENSEAKV